MNDYKEAWFELKNRLENFIWGLENSNQNEERIKDAKTILNKMNDFEQRINN